MTWFNLASVNSTQTFDRSQFKDNKSTTWVRSRCNWLISCSMSVGVELLVENLSWSKNLDKLWFCFLLISNESSLSDDEFFGPTCPKKLSRFRRSTRIPESALRSSWKNLFNSSSKFGLHWHDRSTVERNLIGEQAASRFQTDSTGPFPLNGLRQALLLPLITVWSLQRSVTSIRSFFDETTFEQDWLMTIDSHKLLKYVDGPSMSIEIISD